MQEGKAIIFSAPSGAGKTTIVRRLLTHFNCLEFSISACTRPKREKEIDGKDYYFLTPEDFKRRIASGDFLEWEEVYKDSFYGTLKSELKRIWDKENAVLFDVDVIGGINIKKHLGDKALSVFIVPPSIAVLEERLRKRNTETEESLKRRLDKASVEIAYSDQFDVTLVNIDIENATKIACQKIQDFLKV